MPANRTSNLGCLNMTFTQSLQLLEWTARQVAKGKVGQIPAEQPSILKPLGVGGEGWLKLVSCFPTCSPPCRLSRKEVLRGS